jgi:signal transduction histidine kinase
MLTIRTGLAADETVRELARQPMHRPVLQIEFIDHGPGSANRIVNACSHRFYTRKAKGMGLGLSIVKGIIEAHNGVIREVGQSGELSTRVSGNKAAGAHFVILLPSYVDDGKGSDTV